MLTKHRRVALAVAPLTLLLGTLAMATKPTSDLSCEIRSSQSAGGVRLEAIATARVPMSGEYEFVIAKSGSGGSSDVTQGGEFEVGPGNDAVLGEVTLGPGEATSVKALLRLNGPGGKALCESRYPSRA